MDNVIFKRNSGINIYEYDGASVYYDQVDEYITITKEEYNKLKNS